MEKRLLVIQEHHALKAGLHWDIRFESGGNIQLYLEKRSSDTSEPKTESGPKVLRSFVIPKHEFPTKGKVRMAIRTEDHPWDYKDFEGHIPYGVYGAGEVKLIFSDYVNVSKFKIIFREEKVIYYSIGRFCLHKNQFIKS